MHKHMAGCEDMSQPLHNLCGQKLIPKLLKLKMTRVEKILGEKKVCTPHLINREVFI